MKNISKITAIVAFMFISITSMAHEPKLSIDKETQSKTLIFELDSSSHQSFIELMDSQNNVIFYESVTNDSYSKKFNLKKLKAGTYFFKVENQLSNAVYTININNKEVKIAEKKENTIKPVFRKIGTKTYISFLNINIEDVDIKIIDSNGRLVFKESFNNNLVVARILNFEKAEKGKYRIIVKSSNDSYSENIDII